MIRPLSRLFRRAVHPLRKPEVVYHPPFDDRAELASHYWRARWYLPFQPGVCERVYLHAHPEFPPGVPDRPAYVGATAGAGDHVRIETAGPGRRFIRLMRARAVLVWTPKRFSPLMLLLRLTGAQVLHVATRDPAALEFGTYPSVLWRHLLTGRRRREIIAQNADRFRTLAGEIRSRGLARACVFGTGPSLEQAYRHDFSGALCIVCNTIVQDDRLLDRLRPAFICAGDAVRHFGPSAYACRFRADLLRQLDSRDLRLFTTAMFGYLFVAHFPEYRDRVFFAEQDSDDPVFDLVEHFGLSRLDSTMNIHMLPLAATFANEIYLLGCDGKSAARDNEDFWAHADRAQYREAVDSGHLCHPTFDPIRQRTTYDRYTRSLRRTIEAGERAGRQYVSLAPSAVDVINARFRDPAAGESAHG